MKNKNENVSKVSNNQRLLLFVFGNGFFYKRTLFCPIVSKKPQTCYIVTLVMTLTEHPHVTKRPIGL